MPDQVVPFAGPARQLAVTGGLAGVIAVIRDPHVRRLVRTGYDALEREITRWRNRAPVQPRPVQRNPGRIPFTRIGPITPSKLKKLVAATRGRGGGGLVRMAKHGRRKRGSKRKMVSKVKRRFKTRGKGVRRTSRGTPKRLSAFKSELRYLKRQPRQVVTTNNGSGIPYFKNVTMVNHVQSGNFVGGGQGDQSKGMSIPSLYPNETLCGGPDALANTTTVVATGYVRETGKEAKGWAFNAFPYNKYIVKNMSANLHLRNTTNKRIRVWWYNDPSAAASAKMTVRSDTWNEVSENAKIQQRIIYPTSPDNRGDNLYIKWGLRPANHFVDQEDIEADPVSFSKQKTIGEFQTRTIGATVIGSEAHSIGPMMNIHWEDDAGAPLAQDDINITVITRTRVMFYDPKDTFDPVDA